MYTSFNHYSHHSICNPSPSYAPIRLVLKPGQLLFINKMRLHIFRKLSFYEQLDEKDCFHKLREQLIASTPLNERDDRCVSLAWDTIFIGISSLGIARELTTSLRAQFNSSAKQREDDCSSQVIGKVMHFTLSLASKLFFKCQSGSTIEETDLNTIRGILPILYIAKLELCNAEKYIKEEDILDDATKGRGELNDDRYECISCFAELYGYYVVSKKAMGPKKKGKKKGRSKPEPNPEPRPEPRPDISACLECYEGKNFAFDKKEKTYWRRTKHITGNSVDDMIKTFEARLNQGGERFWWEPIIRQNLVTEYRNTHPYLL